MEAIKLGINDFKKKKILKQIWNAMYKGRKLKSLVRERETAGSDGRAGWVGQEIKGLGPLGRPGEYIRRSTKRKDCRVDLPTYSF